MTLLEGDLSFYELMKVMNAQKQRRGIEHVRQRLHDIDDYIAGREARLARINLFRTQPR
ncbi:MAG: hypothetical protein PUG30_05330 [Actinomycetaceae bacterium]|nr:hypothetical protein [Actinomycetaceae bacterium]